MPEQTDKSAARLVWQVGSLCRAVADSLDARFNPVSVLGEISGLSRAASGHCYFSLKDDGAQIRCALFRRAATLLNFVPRDGELVELQGRLAVYEPRGDLQLIVENISRAGQGTLFEQFLQLKARLETEGLFDAGRKRSLPPMPRAIGLVTSLGAAALHDVVTALRRRVPHIPVVLAPASVQGASAPADLRQALASLYQLTDLASSSATLLKSKARKKKHSPQPVVDVILLVRGGGSMEDLWAFNDEALARLISQSPVPVVCGVGHETDFSIADFVADVRAPTPTAAAELVAQPRDACAGALVTLAERLQQRMLAQLDRLGQRLDFMGSRIGRPSARLARQQLRLASLAQRLQLSSRYLLKQKTLRVQAIQDQLPSLALRAHQRHDENLAQLALRLDLLNPALVLQRGYALLSSGDGQTISSVQQIHAGQAVRATLADGVVDLTVSALN